MKLPRTLRLDPSDVFVFDRAAEPGEFAVSGAFAFANIDPSTMSHKARVAMRSGFMGVDSLGWSTLVEVADGDAEAMAARLAAQLVRHFGAPDLATALVAAREEVAFAASLCDLPLGTVVAVSRTMGEDGLSEQFRTLTARADRAPPVFALVESDEDPDHVDLTHLLQEGRP
jgi:hypothetical protein